MLSKNTLATIVFAGFFFLSPLALSETGASNKCSHCANLIKKGKELLNQLPPDKRAFNPEDYDSMVKQADVRTSLAKLIASFLHKNPVISTESMDAIITVWLMGVDYERQSEIGEWNYLKLKPWLASFHARLDQKIAKEKNKIQKKRLEKIKSGLIGAEGSYNGDPQ